MSIYYNKRPILSPKFDFVAPFTAGHEALIFLFSPRWCPCHNVGHTALEKFAVTVTKQAGGGRIDSDVIPCRIGDQHRIGQEVEQGAKSRFVQDEVGRGHLSLPN